MNKFFFEAFSQKKIKRITLHLFPVILRHLHFFSVTTGIPFFALVSVSRLQITFLFLSLSKACPLFNYNLDCFALFRKYDSKLPCFFAINKMRCSTIMQIHIQICTLFAAHVFLKGKLPLIGLCVNRPNQSYCLS